MRFSYWSEVAGPPFLREPWSVTFAESLLSTNFQFAWPLEAFAFFVVTAPLVLFWPPLDEELAWRWCFEWDWDRMAEDEVSGAGWLA